jgi:hypothetical protein
MKKNKVIKNMEQEIETLSKKAKNNKDDEEVPFMIYGEQNGTIVV